MSDSIGKIPLHFPHLPLISVSHVFQMPQGSWSRTLLLKDPLQAPWHSGRHSATSCKQPILFHLSSRPLPWVSLEVTGILMWWPPQDGQQFNSSVAEQVSGGTCRLVQLQGGESDNLGMLSPGGCHSCPDTKACVFQDSQRQPGRLHCWAYFNFYFKSQKLHRETP